MDVSEKNDARLTGDKWRVSTALPVIRGIYGNQETGMFYKKYT